LLRNGLRPPLTREPLRACRAGERADGHLPGYGAANMMNVSRGAVGALKHQVNQEIGCVEHPQKPEESLNYGSSGMDVAAGDGLVTAEALSYGGFGCGRRG